MVELKCNECLWHGPEEQAKQEPMTIITGYKLNGEPVEMQSFELRCPICGAVGLMPGVVEITGTAPCGYNAMASKTGGAGGSSESSNVKGNAGMNTGGADVDFEKLLAEAGGEGDDVTINLGYQSPASIFEAICMYYGLPPFEAGAFAGDTNLGIWVQNAAKKKKMTVQELEDEMGFTEYKLSWMEARLQLLVRYETLTGYNQGSKQGYERLQEIRDRGVRKASGILTRLIGRARYFVNLYEAR